LVSSNRMSFFKSNSCVCVYVPLYMCVCVSVCVCTHAHVYLRKLFEPAPETGTT
jgi:hypothetical protein